MYIDYFIETAIQHILHIILNWMVQTKNKIAILNLILKIHIAYIKSKRKLKSILQYNRKRVNN